MIRLIVSCIIFILAPLVMAQNADRCDALFDEQDPVTKSFQAVGIDTKTEQHRIEFSVSSERKGVGPLASLIRELNSSGVRVFYDPARLAEVGGRGLYQSTERTLYVDSRTLYDPSRVTPRMAHEARHALDFTSKRMGSTSVFRLFIKGNWGRNVPYHRGFTIHEFVAMTEELVTLFEQPHFVKLIDDNQSRPFLVAKNLIEFQKRITAMAREPITLERAQWNLGDDGLISIHNNNGHFILGNGQVDFTQGHNVYSTQIDKKLNESLQKAALSGNQSARTAALRRLLDLLNSQLKNLAVFASDNEEKISTLADVLSEFRAKNIKKKTDGTAEQMRVRAFEVTRRYQNFLMTFF